MAIDTSGLYFPKPRDKAGDEILSDHQWRKRRKVLYQLAGERCQKCGQHCQGEFEVHHKMRRGMGGGRRRDNMDNLLVLCIPCHQKVHGQDIEVEHADCSGEAVIVVGTDRYTGCCQCACHNSLKPKRIEERQELSA